MCFITQFDTYSVILRIQLYFDKANFCIRTLKWKRLQGNHFELLNSSCGMVKDENGPI